MTWHEPRWSHGSSFVDQLLLQAACASAALTDDAHPGRREAGAGTPIGDHAPPVLSRSPGL